MYLALYRKWRPRTFDDVISQEHITATIQNQIRQKKPSHAYLFTGSRGTGKTTCARILAMAVNCENPQNGNPCLCCESCRSILDGTNMDIQEIDAASNNGVDNIRQLREEAYFLPTVSKYRVYIIDEVHMLSQAAFNALLKIMEEPPEHVLFVMATTEVQKVPATILSRCQRFDFHRIRSTDIVKRLKQIAENEDFTLTDEAAAAIAHLADGGMRDALSLTDQCIAYSHDITEDTVIAATGVTGRDYLFSICDCILQNDAAKALSILGALYDQSKDIQIFCEELAGQFRDIMILKAGNGEVELSLTLPSEREKMQEYAANFSLARLLRYLQILQETLDAMSKYADKRLNMEMCIIRICNPAADHAPQSLLQRIEQLEWLLQGGALPQEKAASSAARPDISPAKDSQEASPFIPPESKPAQSADTPKPQTGQPLPTELPAAVPQPKPSPRQSQPNAENAPSRAIEPEQESKEKPVPFARWEEILEKLKTVDPFIYGLVFNAMVFEQGNYLYMKSPMGSLVSNLKKDNASVRLLSIIKQVTGSSYKLRLAKESTAAKSPPPAADPLMELAERARLAGVDIVEIN